MKKFICLIFVTIILISVTFASTTETISIGPGYGFGAEFTNDAQTVIHGPAIAFTGITKFNNSKLALFADAAVGFPLEIISDLGKVKRKDYNMLISLDAAFGLGYQSKLKNAPLYSTTGIGLYINELGATTDYVGIVAIGFGGSLFVDLQYFFNDNWFVDFTLRDNFVFYNLSIIKTASGSNTVTNTDFGMYANAKIGVGYKFDFD